MAILTCSLNELLNNNNCDDTGGVSAVYWTEGKNIDREAMVADPLKFDPATRTVLGYTMLNGAVFYKMEFKRKDAIAEATYTKETGFYALTVNLIIKGQSLARRNTLDEAVRCCDLVLHVYYNNGTQRVFGFDFDGEVLEEILEPLSVGRHLDSSGQLGSSKSRDELDLVGESLRLPLYAQVTRAELPL